MGVAEQDLLGAAAGLAAVGRTPVAVTFAVFATLRAAEPLRTSICYPRLNVKVIGGYAALSDSKDGATHQSIEDVAIARALPNLVVLSPSDPTLARKVMRAAIEHDGPVYIRLEYEDVPRLHDPALDVTIGRGILAAPRPRRHDRGLRRGGPPRPRGGGSSGTGGCGSRRPGHGLAQAARRGPAARNRSRPPARS